MQLPVLTSAGDSSKLPWYADGLKFTCTQCGNCCTGAPGVVWISDVEVRRLAEFLRLTVEETLIKYCRMVDGRWSLNEVLSPAGEHDCVFLRSDGAGKRTCGVYGARPLQCRTWPFWAGNLGDAAAWERAGRRCPGMGMGREYSVGEIEALRDAKDWPG
jgi:uncharacterized protein